MAIPTAGKASISQVSFEAVGFKPVNGENERLSSERHAKVFMSISRGSRLKNPKNHKTDVVLGSTIWRRNVIKTRFASL